MAGNWKGVTATMEHIEHAKKACNDRIDMLDGEELASPPKKQKSNGNYGNANEGVVVVQNKCAVINIIGSAVGSVGEALCSAGIAKEDGKGLKDE